MQYEQSTEQNDSVQNDNEKECDESEPAYARVRARASNKSN